MHKRILTIGMAIAFFLSAMAMPDFDPPLNPRQNSIYNNNDQLAWVPDGNCYRLGFGCE